MGERLLTRAEMTQRSPSLPQHKLQLIKSDILEHIAQPKGSSTVWKMSFFFFQAVQLVIFQGGQFTKNVPQHSLLFMYA